MSQRNPIAALEDQPQLLRGILRGLEKESLRVDADGALAQTAHPQALGAALCHPRITTDYSEALLEFITEPHCSVETLLQQLDDTHRYTYSGYPYKSPPLPCFEAQTMEGGMGVLTRVGFLQAGSRFYHPGIPNATFSAAPTALPFFATGVEIPDVFSCKSLKQLQQ